jgi:hypothetical protein
MNDALATSNLRPGAYGYVGAGIFGRLSTSSPKLKGIRQIVQKYLVVCDFNGIPTRSALATAAFCEAKNQGDVIEIAKSLNLPLLKKVKNIDGIFPRLVVLEQTLITFGYREIKCLSASWE